MDMDWQSRIDALFAGLDRAGPGAAVAVYRDGQIAYARGFGCAHLEHGTPIGPDTRFHVASLSKQFTAMLVGLLAREGRISLDDDMRRWIPELPPGPPLTFRQAIHHTSGLREQWDLLRLAGWRDADIKTTPDILAISARQTAFNFAPGTRFQYGNTAYTMLAVAVERITGSRLSECAERMIFAPLGMRDTLFLDDASRVVVGRAQAYAQAEDGGFSIRVPNYETVGPTNLFTTVRDFARWERNFLAPVVGDAELIEETMRPGRLAGGDSTGYGFGLIVGRRGEDATVEHAGGDAGFRAYYLRVPGHRVAVAVFANLLELSPGRLAHGIADILLPPLPGAASAGGAVLDGYRPYDVDRIRGLYRDPESGLTCRIELCGGRLAVNSGGGSYELAQLGPLSFRFIGLDVVVTFLAEKGEAATAMTVRYGGATTVCERIAESREAADAGRLGDYCGTYRSEELDATYSIGRHDGGLLVRGPRALAIRLQRIGEDWFSARDTTLDVQFRRDAEQRIRGYVLSSDRAWNIGFSRL